MKKITAIFLAAALMLSLTACASLPVIGGNHSPSNKPDSTEPQIPSVDSNSHSESDADSSGNQTQDLDAPPPVEEDPAEEPTIKPDPNQTEAQTPTTDTTKPNKDPDPSVTPPVSGTRELDPSKPMVALTFDDGPHPEYTNQILDILEQYGAVATFFEVGQNLSRDPDAVRRAAAMGCEIGSHSLRHRDLSKLSSEDLLADLAAADEQFISVLGKAPNLLRPPYGALNKKVKYETGRSIITWSIDTEDWLSLDADKIMATVQQAGNLNGDVILMHSTHAPSVEAASRMVPWLIEQGYQLVTITEMITLHYGDQVLPNGTYGYSYFVNGKDVILPPADYVPGA